MLNLILILLGKLFSKTSSTLNLGHGSTWPGHIALSVNKNFVSEQIKKSKTKIILIAGTNGKTTTGKLIQKILEENGNKVFQNEAGANLLNGIASSILLHSSFIGKINYDYAIFEVDENSLPLVLNELTPDYIILMNLFRDQLDRYGEVDSIAKKWKKSLDVIARSPEATKAAIPTTFILNADDPQIAYLGLSLCHSERSEESIPFKRHAELVSASNSESFPKILYFGLNNKKIAKEKNELSADSTYCPKCNTKLKYEEIYFSHLGNWHCPKCGIERPKLDLSAVPNYPLPGTYNMYNTHAAVLFAKINNIKDTTIEQSLQSFTPAFGRQEEIEIDGKKVKIFLSKNPTSFNESIRTIKELKGKNLLIVLNDRIPDGRDVSWIWDTSIEESLENIDNIVVSGDRTYDMALRLKYAGLSKFQTEENLQKAVQLGLKKLSSEQTLYILPTYSAMLEVRKILTGKKIL